MQQKITPNIWFNGNAKEAVDFYVSIFPDSRIVSTSHYPKTSEEGLADFQRDLAGDVLTIEFELSGMAFMAINADDTFTPNASISFMVNFDPSQDDQAREHLDKLWEQLTDGGEVLMPLGEQPYSQRYGWVKDRYGVTWQLILTNPEGELRPFIIPCLMFGQEATNRAEEAIKYYISVFAGAPGADSGQEETAETGQGTLARYPGDTGPAKAGSLMFADFQLAGEWLAAMDSGVEQAFTFTPAISLLIACKDQAEIDYFWEKLSTAPEFEQCGWCVDQFGVSWQINPANIEELMKRPGAFAKFMDMKKIVIADF